MHKIMTVPLFFSILLFFPFLNSHRIFKKFRNLGNNLPYFVDRPSMSFFFPILYASTTPIIQQRIINNKAILNIRLPEVVDAWAAAFEIALSLITPPSNSIFFKMIKACCTAFTIISNILTEVISIKAIPLL